MSKFNVNNKGKTKTVNLAGGRAYSQNPKEELATLVASSFLKSQFYRTEDDTLNRIKELVDIIPDKKFVAKAAIWGRHTMGMRSVSHAVASFLAPHLAGTEYGARFYSKVPRIGQDATEIVSAHKALNNTGKMSMAMKKGLKIFLEKLDIYSLQKYAQLGHELNMFDLINLTHAKSEAIAEFKKRSKTRTLQKVTTEAIVSNASKNEGGIVQAYNDMINKGLEGASGSVGYLAMIRNLNTILKEEGVNTDKLVALLTNQEAILKSKVFPHQILTAIYYLLKKDYKYKGDVRSVLSALDKALELSVPNAKPMEGKVLVAVDCSSSMQGYDNVGAIHYASMFAAIIAKTTPSSDIMVYGTEAHYAGLNRNDSLSTMASVFGPNMGGTDFGTVFKKANKHYDKIIFLTDNENWNHDSLWRESVNISLKRYSNKYGKPSHIYTIQFEAYGTKQFADNIGTTFAGYNDRVFEMIANAKSADALVKEIEGITI